MVVFKNNNPDNLTAPYKIGERIAQIKIQEVIPIEFVEVEELSENGESYAHFILHCKYYFDPSNKNLAFEFVKKASQKKDIPLAFLRLGTHYGWGVGTKQNHILAMHNYLKAFDLGCKEACSFIGSEYEWGTAKTQKNLDRALEEIQNNLIHIKEK
jgi:TPR repeat protein